MKLVIDGSVHDAVPKRPRLVFPFNRKKAAVSVTAVRKLCEEIAADPKVQGLVVDVSRLQCGYATAAELRDALALVPAAKKKLHAHLPRGGGLKEYFVASAADNISMPPHAMLFLVGMGGKGFYLKDALDKTGVEIEVEQRYEFKSAGEMFSRSDMSEAAKAQHAVILEAMAERVFSAAEGRALKHPDGRKLLHRGPYRAEEAKTLGLIEHVLFDDAVGKALGHKDDTLKATGARAYLQRRLGRYFLPLRRARHVVVLPLRGTIVDEGMQPSQLAAGPVVKVCEALADNPAVAAVVLCIDSRGGSASASAEMHRAIIKLAEKKPVVSYLSDYAASGGYYIACGAPTIVANPLSVTGSIGVISMRPIIDRVLARIGITRDGLRIGDHAGLLDATERFSAAEQQAMRRLIDGIYGEFTGVVQASRKLSAEALDALARGRVWLGSNTAFTPLRDQVGGLQLAVAEARKKLERPAADEIVVLEPPRPRVGFSLFPFAALPSWRDLAIPVLGLPLTGGTFLFGTFSLEEDR